MKDKFEEGAIVAGVLSGTSADGIDVVLTRLRIDGEERSLQPPEMLAFETLAFPGSLAPSVRAVLDGATLDLRGAALLSRDLGRAFGRAARDVADRNGLVLDLCGSHGQTVWHHDGVEPAGRATLQLGDGDFVAEEAGCTVVSDFRQRDIAAGGEGAPIAALADVLLFGNERRPVAILNLGGMGNLTVLEQGKGPLSFDTGPANALLDGLARRLFDRPFDEQGEWAARGTPSPELVAELLEHPFLAEDPPRSTGRDTFGERWIDGLAEASSLAPQDLMASAVEFVGRTVGLAFERHVSERPRRLFVAGGGAHNLTLCAAIERAVGLPAESSARAGVDPDAREALAFAVLAARCVLGIPVTSPRATGAEPGRVLGKISPAPA
jgi:anhydro-N-acetylmuramic acid kinase